MKILVTVKRVPDPEQKVKIKGNAHRPVRRVNWQLNTFDEYAVETALRLTENGDGRQRARRRGRRRVDRPEGRRSSSCARRWRWAPTARSSSTASDDGARRRRGRRARLQKHRRAEKPDLVAHGQAGGRRRREPGRPDAGRQARLAAGDVRRARIELADDGKALHVGREVDAGVEDKRCRCRRWSRSTCASSRRRRCKNGMTPATHAYAAKAPRYASLKGIMAAKKKPIEETHARRARRRPRSRAIEDESRRGCRRARKAGIKVAVVDELVQKLARRSEGDSDGQRPRRSVEFAGRRRSARRAAGRRVRRARLRQAHGGDARRCSSSATGVGGAGADAAKYAPPRSSSSTTPGSSTTWPRPTRRSSRSVAKENGATRRRRRPRPRPARTCCRAWPRCSTPAWRPTSSSVDGAEQVRAADPAPATRHSTVEVDDADRRRHRAPDRVRAGRSRAAPPARRRAAPAGAVDALGAEFVSRRRAEERAPRARPTPRSSSRAAAA